MLQNKIDLEKFKKDDLDDRIMISQISNVSIGSVKGRKYNGRIKFYSELVQFSYNGLQMLYEKTGEEAKRREFEEKTKEWRKLQKEKKSEEDKKMDFEEMVKFVKNT